MSSAEQERSEPVRALGRELGKVGTQAILLSQAIADRLGLHTTEVEVLDFMSRVGALTAGQVAEATGLTSGATSRLIDRLERAGYVRRSANPKDRRSVLVVPVAEAIDRTLRPLNAPLERALGALCSRLDDDELGLVCDFLRSVNDATREHVKRLRQGKFEGASEERPAAEPR